MAAALALLGSAKAKRRIAVLGDMLEMGSDGPAHHADLAAPIEAARVDSVYLNGVQMKSLWGKISALRQGAYAETSAEIAPLVAGALRTATLFSSKARWAAGWP